MGCAEQIGEVQGVTEQQRAWTTVAWVHGLSMSIVFAHWFFVLPVIQRMYADFGDPFFETHWIIAGIARGVHEYPLSSIFLTMGLLFGDICFYLGLRRSYGHNAATLWYWMVLIAFLFVMGWSLSLHDFPQTWPTAF